MISQWLLSPEGWLADSEHQTEKHLLSVLWSGHPPFPTRKDSTLIRKLKMKDHQIYRAHCFAFPPSLNFHTGHILLFSCEVSSQLPRRYKRSLSRLTLLSCVPPLSYTSMNLVSGFLMSNVSPAAAPGNHCHISFLIDTDVLIV